MAKEVVKRIWTVKCYKCGTLYIPEYVKDGYFERCPVCGCTLNDNLNIISPWKYKWIRFWRNIKR